MTQEEPARKKTKESTYRAPDCVDIQNVEKDNCDNQERENEEKMQQDGRGSPSRKLWARTKYWHNVAR